MNVAVCVVFGIWNSHCLLSKIAWFSFTKLQRTVEFRMLRWIHVNNFDITESHAHISSRCTHLKNDFFPVITSSIYYWPLTWFDFVRRYIRKNSILGKFIKLDLLFIWFDREHHKWSEDNGVLWNMFTTIPEAIEVTCIMQMRSDDYTLILLYRRGGGGQTRKKLIMRCWLWNCHETMSQGSTSISTPYFIHRLMQTKWIEIYTSEA